MARTIAKSVELLEKALNDDFKALKERGAIFNPDTITLRHGTVSTYISNLDVAREDVYDGDIINSNLKGLSNANNATKIVFTDAIPPSSSYAYIARTNQACAWISGSTIYITGRGRKLKIYNAHNLFKDFEKVTSIENLTTWLDTTECRNMSNMFQNCKSLTSINLSNFNTKACINMQGMFYGCQSLRTLDVSSFDTEAVNNMNGMFVECSTLTSLDLTNFNTTSVRNMGGMFRDCTKLKDLKLTNFDITIVDYLDYMFRGCTSMEVLRLDSFGRTSPTRMNNMFYNCSSLKELYIPNFYPVDVGNSRSVFYGCSKLGFLFCNHDWSKVTGGGGFDFFTGCTSLTGYSSSKTTIEYAKSINDGGYFIPYQV